MIDLVSRPRLPHLHHERTRHGALVWYVRVNRGPRIRIREPYGSPEFEVAYRAALDGERPAGKIRTKAGTLNWLVEQYRETQAWTALSLATRKQRENILRPILEQSGDKPYLLVTRRAVQAGLDRRNATPFQARNFLDAMRGLFRWAVEAQHVEVDPTEKLRAPRPKTEGFRVWTESEIARFEAAWPIGTRERLAFDLLLYTGLRRGDVAALGRQHVRDGVVTIRTAKTGQAVTLPILPALAASIAAAPTGDLAFITGVGGRPMVKEAFGNWFREVCNKAGVPGSAHGLRKAGATRAANNGATEAQLEAIFGWRGGGMAALYTRAANRRRLAMDAISKLTRPNETETSIPAPRHKVREPGRKLPRKQHVEK